MVSNEIKQGVHQKTVTDTARQDPSDANRNPLPSISLPKGGGAIRGIGEKFAANPVTGTGSLAVPIYTSPGRSGFCPQFSLTYDSNGGNGPFGFGWSLALPSLTRKTDKGLPQYVDAEESDTFILSGAEDLVPQLIENNGQWTRALSSSTLYGKQYSIHLYRPRIEGLFARIERWINLSDPQDTFWRSISKDNVTTWYGKTAESRIADPTDPARIFTWLVCESYDDKGNVCAYHYKAENSAGVDLSQAHERNRSTTTRSANRYLKYVLYGNLTPYYPDLTANAPVPLPGNWSFELVFDYGEHDEKEPVPQETGQLWNCRADPFSTYRPTFEVRTYRLCRRTLLFHHFANEPGVGLNCLVRSTDFVHAQATLPPPDPTTPFYSYLLSATQTGYIRNSDGSYQSSTMPPLAFTYSAAVINEAVQDIDPESMQNLPYGLDGTNYQWVDLDGEGVSGILTEQAGSWFYKPNLSPANVQFTNGQQSTTAQFGAVELVARQPSLAALGSGRQALLDFTGDGHLDLVEFAGPIPGFFARTQDEDWIPFRRFTSLPVLDWQNPNLTFVDLTGDGLADVLICEDEAFCWHSSLRAAGFGPAQWVPQALDEEQGPKLVFVDGSESIFLADLSGDGLIDLVRIRNGEVCYWPNMGYGNFGAKVTMDQSPWFEASDLFDGRRIKLADIDGSGTIDIVYFASGGVHLYFNQSGNAWGTARALISFPPVESASSATVLDLLGNGTACLVWSSPLANNASRPMRYIDLLGGQKPHLLEQVINNLGAETRIHYAPSTRFYVADKLAGTPWVTRIPFPVHVVERVETYDHISSSRFVTRYAYHHGYYDGYEREFRGFGRVDQWDTEAFEDYVVGVAQNNGKQDLAPELFQPPVTTRSWFHTGAFNDQEIVLHYLHTEYYGHSQSLPEPLFPAGLTDDEWRECARSLKGLPLRQEVYSFDGSAQAQYPYSIVENTYNIQLIQKREQEKYAIFFPSGSETITHYLERNPTDPRIAHTLNLEQDQYGNVLQAASVVYGRQNTDPTLPSEVTADQQKMYITYSEADYTPDLEQGSPLSAYRLRIPYATRAYEITGVTPASALFLLADLKSQIAAATEIPYETLASGTTAQKRLLSSSQALFLDNALQPLPSGQWDTLALPYQSYKMAFTPGVTSAYYTGQIADSDFTTAGYVHFNGDSNWWIPSSTAVYPTNPAIHFYIPTGTLDPLGIETTFTFDSYDLLIEQTQIKQATWTTVSATNDYRVLGPVMVTDPNQNRTAVEIDALGMFVASAVMGKVAAGEGDTLADPTIRMEYDLSNWMTNNLPNYVHVFAREQHGASNPRWQESYVYSNGSGAVAMVKAQAHPGPALQVNPDGTTTEVNANPRWIGNGRTIVNNKGNPIKHYEPYFSTTYAYEDEKTVREIGVTPILYYDAVGRNIRTAFPNGTFSRIEFDAWLQRVFDTNDTVKDSQWYADRGSPDPATQPEPVNDPERRAAWLAAKHANTPALLHFDSLGRTVYAISDYGGGQTAAIRSECDLTGRNTTLYDQLQRVVASSFTGMTGTVIYGTSAEKGQRWTFQNVFGGLVKTWDEHGRTFWTEYDDLHRPLSAFEQESGQAKILFNYVVYGDRNPNAVHLNLLGTAHQVFDQSGMVLVPGIDFQGNPTSVQRVLAQEYRNNVDWSSLDTQPDYASIQTSAAPSLVMTEIFTASSTYDALNRPTRVTLPDNTIIVPTYNEANFLASLQVQIQGQGAAIEFLQEQDYNAKGQRLFAHYGNDVYTSYFYDPQTFRLTNLMTYNSGKDPATQGLQNLLYTYDPVGNVTQLEDTAQQTYYFNNAVVKPEYLYEYDAIYQLVQATGREHAGPINDAILGCSDLAFVPQLPEANDTAAVRTYTETYVYDLLGNISELNHLFKPQSGVGTGWTRHYHYAYQDDPTNNTNRLTSSSNPGDPDAGPYTATYSYDNYGNMSSMPSFSNLAWNFMDQLQHVDLGGGGTAYYVYGAGGQRVRKVIERQGSLRVERIYLGAVEIYRESQGNNAPNLERYTLHIADNTGQIAQVDTKTKDDNNSDPTNPLNTPLIRYQYGNHLGSSLLETDASGAVISYEEYHPYGTSAYRSAKPGFNLSLKRYRFSGKERDDETGLYYFGARYYAAWLGRWTSSDPAGFVDGLNLFRYCRNNPVMLQDIAGTDSKQTSDPISAPSDPKTAARLNRPDADPTEVLHYFQKHGYPGLQHNPVWDKERKLWYFNETLQSATGDSDSAGGGKKDSDSSATGNSTTGDSTTKDSSSEGTGSQEKSTPPASNESSSSATTPPASPSESPRDATSGGAALSQVPAGGERFIWQYYNQFDRGKILEGLYGVPWGSNTKNWDLNLPTKVQQVKSTNAYDTIGDFTRKATRKAAQAIQDNPTTMAGKGAQAVMITPTDAPNAALDDISTALNAGRGRNIPTNALPPENVRGLPGNVGKVGAGLSVVGTALSGYSLYRDIESGDAPMASGDALGTAGGGLELYALATPGAAIAGVSAMSAGLVLGGAGIAVTSGISGYRAYKAGDTAGAVAGAVGVAAGIAIMAGVIFGAPVVLAVGLIAAVGVGLFHLGRWLLS